MTQLGSGPKQEKTLVHGELSPNFPDGFVISPPWSSFQRTGSDVDYYLCFTGTLTSSRLSNPPPYSDYQEFLYDTIVGFREKSWTFKQIAKWFRDNGYETVRGKRFYAKHVFSILKNKRLRDERLNALPEDRLEITSPLRIEYVERKYLNSE